MPKSKPRERDRKVLFVEVAETMLDALDAWAADVERERGTSYSRSDLVREQLHRLIQARKGGR